jgi:predicted ATPase/DNA-binding CsgD family transcriptional regulator
MHETQGESLSVRQAEIAALVASGKSTREIAGVLSLSPRTVETHILAVCNKMGVRSRIELTAAFLTPGSPFDLARAEHALPLRPVEAIPNNLPRKLTSFIGRESELAAIHGLIKVRQLVTLVGSAGVGKTSTSLQVAASMLAHFRDGVWLIELAPLVDGGYVPSAVARALGLTLPVDGDPLLNLANQLKSTFALLVFDNCEHIVDAAAATIAILLRDCRTVKIIASSRQPLRVVGESTFRIPSLTMPKEADAPGIRAAQIPEYEATRLFVTRASAVDNRFAPTDENASDVTEICRRLDGIPLAIELAAARVSDLSPQQLREQLDERFRVLTAGNRDAIPRHRTLSALIDWSHDLLDERERLLFRRLSIFVDGFTLEAAIAIAEGDLEGGACFDALSSLVDKSLVLSEAAGQTYRFRLLESTRFYASRKLAMTCEREATSARHLRYLRDRFGDLRASADQTGMRVEIDRNFATELANIRAALDDASEATDIRVAAELLAYLRQDWIHLGLGAEGIKRIERVLPAIPAGESRLFALLLGSLAHLASAGEKNVLAYDLATSALSHARASGDDGTLALALYHHANKASGARRFAVAEASLAEAESVPGKSAALELSLLRARAFHSYISGNFDAAVGAAERFVAKCRSLGDAGGVRQGIYLLSKYEYSRGNMQRGIKMARENVFACRAAADKWILPASLLVLGACLTSENDLAGAAAAVDEVLELKSGNWHLTTMALEHRALIWAMSGDLRRAAALDGFADAAARRQETDRETDRETYAAMLLDRLRLMLRHGLEPSERERVAAEGAELSLEAAVVLALDANAHDKVEHGRHFAT